MQPIFNHRDSLLVLRYMPIMRLHIGQVVVFTPKFGQIGKSKDEKNHQSVKRIVALSGDTIVGTSKVPLALFPSYLQAFAQDDGEKRTWKIPQRHLFLQGDDPNSVDSKQLGPFPIDCVTGIVLFHLPRVR